MTVIYPDFNNMNQTFLVIMAIILILQLRERKVKVRKLFVMPVFMVLATGAVIYTSASSSITAFALVAAGLAVGIGMGAAIGSLMKVNIHEDGSMLLKGSILAVAVWIALIGVKILGKDTLGGTGYINLSVLSSIFLAMALGAMVTRRAYVYREYMRQKKLQNPA
jgi:membrane protein CcdC involved in cytochrome C biogenesis